MNFMIWELDNFTNIIICGKFFLMGKVINRKKGYHKIKITSPILKNMPNRRPRARGLVRSLVTSQLVSVRVAFRKVKVGVENFWTAWILFRIFLPSSLVNFPLHEYFFDFSRPPLTFLDRSLTKDWIKNLASYFVWDFIRVPSVRLPYYRKLRPVNAYLPDFMFFNKERLPMQHLIYSSWLQC